MLGKHSLYEQLSRRLLISPEPQKAKKHPKQADSDQTKYSRYICPNSRSCFRDKFRVEFLIIVPRMNQRPDALVRRRRRIMMETFCIRIKMPINRLFLWFDVFYIKIGFFPWLSKSLCFFLRRHSNNSIWMCSDIDK